MEQIILNAEQRSKTTKKFKEQGYIPGVIYGDSVEKANSVKFKEAPLKKVIAEHGPNVKLWVQCGDEKKFGFIKEIQKHPVSNKIIHLDVQLVSKNHEIKIQVPILFKGDGELRKRQLQLQIHKTEAEILGKIDSIPETISVDVSQKNAGDAITFEDFGLDKQLKLHDKIDEVFATVTKLVKEQQAEEEADKEAEA